MSSNPLNADPPFPPRTLHAIALIEKRVRESLAFHLYPVHTWNTAKTQLVRLEIISGRIAIYVIARVIERSLHSGTLMFQGISYDYLHTKAMTEGIEEILDEKYGNTHFFLHDVTTLIEHMVRLYLKKLHVLMSGNSQTLSLRRNTRTKRSVFLHESATLH